MSDATTTATAATTTTATATTQGHGISWLPADADADMVGHVQNKAWAGAVDAVKGHRELEKLLGADRAGRTITIPTTADAPEWAQVWTKLGKPQGPDGYGIKPADGADPKFAQAAAEVFHKANLTAGQAQMLAAWYSEQGGAATSAQFAAEQAALEAEHAALSKDWGTGPDAGARKELARRAAVHLGLDEGAIDAMEKVAGFSKTMKALAQVGDMLREHGVEGIGDVGSFGMTPEGASAKRKQLMADADWRSRAMNPNSAQWAELQKLDRVIASVHQ
ncbi:MAG: hypothetical protein RLZZ373_2683 [Pseudomonadota bacterium]|jgi:hypothetical protein